VKGEGDSPLTHLRRKPLGRQAVVSLVSYQVVLALSQIG
jgi:hypothetical protein